MSPAMLASHLVAPLPIQLSNVSAKHTGRLAKCIHMGDLKEASGTGCSPLGSKQRAENLSLSLSLSVLVFKI